MTLKELLSVQVFSLATGSEKTLASTPSVASVITAEDIKLLGAKTMSEVLDTIPGVHVSLSNESYSPKFIIRGISTQTNAQTLVLVDGTPISSVVRDDRQVVWGNFTTAAISRIEIIRGLGSALHGADAFAGVQAPTIQRSVCPVIILRLAGQLICH